MFGIESRIDSLDREKAANQQTGAGEQHHRESEFHHHEQAARVAQRNRAG